MWVEFDRSERLAAAAKILLARRVDDSRVWEPEGHRGAVEYLAEKSGTSNAVSRGGLATPKKIGQLSRTQAALRRGELSTLQAECITDAASHNREAEDALLETAKASSLGSYATNAHAGRPPPTPIPMRRIKLIATKGQQVVKSVVVGVARIVGT